MALSAPERHARNVATPLLILLIIGVAAPLVMVLIRALTGYGDQPSALPELTNPHHLRTLGNTIVLGVMVVAIATAMAAPLAFLMSWTRMRSHRWIDVVVMLPFMTPPYVSAMAWIDLTRYNGLGDQFFGATGGDLLRFIIMSPFGMALIMASEVFTFLYLILRNYLDSVPASSDEAAAVAGASAGQRFRLILLPLCTPTYSLGALIVFIRAVGEFGTPVTLGNQIGFPVLVSEIYRSVTINPLDFPTAAALSSVLLALGCTVWVIQQWVSRKEHPFGGRAQRRTTVTLNRRTATAGWFWFGLVAVVSVVIPYVGIFLGAMTLLRSQPITLDNLTFDYFGLVLQSAGGQQALTNSTLLALIATTLATMVGIATTLASTRLKHHPLGRSIDLLAVGPDTVPTIVLAIGLIFLWNAPWLPATPYNSPAMLVLGYTLVLLPMIVQNIKTSRSTIDERYLEAAITSGATGVQTFFRITLPLLMPGIIAGWLLGLLLAFREVVISSLLRPASYELLSPWIMSQFDQGFRAEAMAMTVIGVLGSAGVLVLVDTMRRRYFEKRD
ncbi:iron ABC transporter permease [Auritidibacter sp. NML100628]|uniref:ABC transporter permease n=1 Tax=Auritidibacter sp. NML100628 TaxID=2170742 RepID=UPI000D73AD20|nr:iron ABC transporter permease [Auritidibacter sp. NML100628]PXA78341.1 iron ABC transporter permease [Auritidibacter sp. NML100628]PXA80804.1 iron ABC transporter permease [Auritidibacter sp. NML120779]